MKYQIIFLVSLACVLIATEATPTKVCEPGTVVKKDCNTCKCSTDGTEMACTRKICEGSEDGVAPVNDPEKPAEETAERAAEPKEQNDESDTCTPGETFKKDCNDCTCPPSGLKSAGACTLLACLDDAIQKD